MNDPRPRIDPSKIRLPHEGPRLPKMVACIICGDMHVRRSGIAHETRPLCQKCSDAINNQPEQTAAKDTIDCNVRGF